MEPRTRRRGLVALAFTLLFAVGVWAGARPEIGAATDSADGGIVLRADFESHVDGWRVTRRHCARFPARRSVAPLS
jgi:hypothetical protein